MTMSSLALLTGGELSVAHDGAGNTITMTQTEIVKIDSEDQENIILANAAKAGSYVYIGKMINGVVSTVTRLINKLETETNTITLADFYNFAGGAQSMVGEYRVFYEYELGTADVENGHKKLTELSVLADKFAGTYKFIGDTLLFNQFTGLNDVFQIEIPKLKLDGSFSFSFNAATEAAVFSFKGKALRDDLGQMIIFRTITEDEQKVAETGALGQLDGRYEKVPAKEVTVDPVSGDLADTGRVYPISDAELSA